MSVLISYFIRKNSDILSVESSKRSCAFEDWKHDYQNTRIIQKLNAYRTDDVVESPEEIIIKREENKEMLRIVRILQKELGVLPFKFLIERYVYNRKIKDIATKYGRERNSVSRSIRNNTRKAIRILKRLASANKIDLDIFHQPKQYFDAKVPTIKVNYPSDSAKHSFDCYYKYNNLKKYRTKCMIPEYLEDTFGDCNTVCSQCFTQLGVNNCTRKKQNSHVKFS